MERIIDMYQRDLFTAASAELAGPSVSAQRNSATSVAAAEAVKPDAPTLRACVLAFIRSKGTDGATDEEVQNASKMNPSTERPRRIELWRAGFVGTAGNTRPTRSGRRATVWRAV